MLYVLRRQFHSKSSQHIIAPHRGKWLIIQIRFIDFWTIMSKIITDHNWKQLGSSYIAAIIVTETFVLWEQYLYTYIYIFIYNNSCCICEHAYLMAMFVKDGCPLLSDEDNTDLRINVRLLACAHTCTKLFLFYIRKLTATLTNWNWHISYKVKFIKSL